MKICIFLFCLMFGLIFGINVQADPSTWTMSVQKEDLSPFKHRNGYGPGGINVDLITAISDELGMQLDFKDYTISEGREKFLTGELNVDCCLNKVWFTGQDGLHVFSDPIYRLIEVFVFPMGKKFPVPTTKALKDKRVVGISGFTYPNQEDYGTRLNGNSPMEVLEMLRDGKADVAVMERHAAAFLINHYEFEVEYGDPYYSVGVGVRLHRSEKHHLVAINKAIEKLKASGFVQDVIKRNIK